VEPPFAAMTAASLLYLNDLVISRDWEFSSFFKAKLLQILQVGQIPLVYMDI